jgi:hypothetical protein
MLTILVHVIQHTKRWSKKGNKQKISLSLSDNHVGGPEEAGVCVL